MDILKIKLYMNILEIYYKLFKTEYMKLNLIYIFLYIN